MEPGWNPLTVELLRTSAIRERMTKDTTKTFKDRDMYQQTQEPSPTLIPSKCFQVSSFLPPHRVVEQHPKVYCAPFTPLLTVPLPECCSGHLFCLSYFINKEITMKITVELLLNDFIRGSEHHQLCRHPEERDKPPLHLKWPSKHHKHDLPPYLTNQPSGWWG